MLAPEKKKKMFFGVYSQPTCGEEGKGKSATPLGCVNEPSP